MNRNHVFRFRYWAAAVLLAAAGILIIGSFLWLPALTGIGQAGSLTPRQVVEQAWQRARELGSYHFSTNLEAAITATGQPVPENSARYERLYIEGQVDLPAQKMELTMWEKGGIAFNTHQGIQIKLEGGKTYGRVGSSDWQEMEDATDAFAPGRDPMAYLAGARDIYLAGTGSVEVPTPEGTIVVNYTRYGFTVDGVRFARSLSSQLERQIAESGEIPPGVKLDATEAFRDLTGQGEAWIDEAGLPLRLIVDLKYPEQYGEQTQAQIETDFSGYPEPSATALSVLERLMSWTQGALNLPATGEAWGDFGLRASMLIICIAFVLIMVGRSRSRAIYITFAVVIILSMLVSPIWESQKVLAYTEKIQAQRQEAEAQQAFKQSQTSPDWDPQQNPLAESEASAANLDMLGDPVQPLLTFGGTQTIGVGDSSEINPNSDDDGDGLTYQEEMRLGTDPTLLNSDLDELGDGLEVKGFDFLGVHYYTNPISSDTASDGVLDTLECWNSTPATLPTNTAGCTQDSDNDGQLDIFETDNDNDGVADSVDLSAFSARDGFSSDNPFQLIVSKLEQKPVLVDLQIRPTNPEHLAYTLSVLDWPTGDTQGQVQRVLNNTFATAVDNPLTPEEIAADPRVQYGDIRLIPMLEINVPYKEGHTRNLPIKPGFTRTLEATTPLEDWVDQGKLDKYGISAHYVDETGRLAIYAPLNLVTDETGGSYAAFQSRIYYEPQSNGDWGNAQEVRVVWWVQVLTDQCDSSAYDENTDGEFEEWCARPENRIESAQIVHTYPEQWSLTGLSVREDYGLETIVAFEDPDFDANVNDDDYLWKLANGMDSAFMTARDCDPLDPNGECKGDGLRDVTLNEIERRFDNRRNSTIPVGDPVLWNIPNTALQVWKEEFPHQDYLITTVTTTTMQILDSKFLPNSSCKINCTTPRAAAPTLLFGTEAHARTANLDLGGITMGWVGSLLTVDMDPGVISLDTLATMSWSPFRYASGEWEVYPLEEYLVEFDKRLDTAFPIDPYDPESEDEVHTQKAIVASYYLGLTQGTSATVESGGVLNESAWGVKDTAIVTSNLTEAFKRTFSAIWGVIQLKEGSGVWKKWDVDTAWRYQMEHEGGGDPTKFPTGYMSSFVERMCAGVKLGTTIAMALVAVTFMALSLALDPPPACLPFIQNGLMALGSTVLIGISFVSMVRPYITGGLGLSKEWSRFKEFSHTKGFKLAVAGFVVDILAQTALFIYTMVATDDMSGWEIGAYITYFIITLAVTAILFALTMIPLIGDIIAAVIALLNAVFNIVCAALGDDFKESWGGIICKGVAGILGTILFKAIYSAQALPYFPSEEEEDDKKYGGLEQSSPELTLVDPGGGFKVGAQLSYTFDLTRTIRLTSYDELENWKARQWSDQFNEKNLKKTTFEYLLTAQEANPHEGLYLGKEKNWISLGEQDGVPWVEIRRPLSNQQYFALGYAGINQAVATYYNEGYDLPIQECWGWPMPPVSGCGIASEADSGHSEIGQYFLYDIFPPGLDGFRSLQPVTGGYRLAWGGASLAFPVMMDADGDGLSTGSDPGDGTWDFDHDGLSDVYELQFGFNPREPDSDYDTLGDRQELLIGSDPNSADSDTDGLTDKLEVEGWDFVYGWTDATTPKIIRVKSNPRLYDSDYDGLSDQKEWLYGWNPMAVSEGDVLTFSSELKERDAAGQYSTSDGVVRRSDALRFEANVKNELDLRYARGLLSAQYPADSLNGSVVPNTFVLAPRELATIQGDLSVTASSSGPLTLTQIAGAELYNAQAISNYAVLLLHLEEAADATTFLDESGGVVRHNAACVGSECPVRQAPGMLGKGVRFTDQIQQISVGSVDVSKGSLGVTMWISTTQTGGYLIPSLVPFNSNGGSVKLTMNNTGLPCVEVRTTPVTPKICGPSSINNGDWHHLAFNYDATKAPQVMTLYVDGTQVTSQTATARATYTYDVTGVSFGQGYLGDLDEVAVYNRVLTPEEIDTANNAPLSLHAPLDEPAGATTFIDVNQGNNGDCSLFPPCPTMGGRGISRTSAKFNGQQHIDFDFRSQLTNGFTVAAWIQPENTGTTSIDDHWQGVVGAQGSWCEMKGLDPHFCSFPSIERKGDCIRSEFGDMANVYRVGPVCGVAPLNTWSHISVAFSQATVNDPGYYTLYVNGKKVGETILNPRGTKYAPFGGLIFTAGCSWIDWNGTTPNLCFTDPAQYTNPFHGSIDELRVYKLGLTAEQINDLYASESLPVYLHLDDAPGSYLYPEANGHDPASCPSNLAGCPTSGVAGRMNLASLFSSLEGDGLSTQASLDLGYNSPGATLMAWVYPTSGGSSFQMVLGTDDGNQWSKEWRLWREPNNGGTWGIENGSYTWVSSLPVEENRWQHITAVFSPGSPNGSTKIYKNCGAGGTASHTDLFYPNQFNNIFIGCDNNNIDCFQGKLDEVKVFNRALSDSEVQAVCAEVPQILLHMEELYGATTFIDDSQSGHNATCANPAATATCPSAGVNGQVGLAAEFDGLDDGLKTTYTLGNHEATFMAWVYPNSSTSLAQSVIGSIGTDHVELYREGGTWKLRLANNVILAPAYAKVRPNEWQHLAVIISKSGVGTSGKLYLNGSPVSDASPAGGYTLYNASFGFNPAANNRYFDGRIDEVATYDYALTPEEVKVIYDYQAGWVEQVKHTELTVDNDLPSVKINPPGSAISIQSVQLRIDTADATTSVSAVQWRVNGGTWAHAPACKEADSAAAWCPTFTPSGPGSYTIEAIATDLAGNNSATASTTLLVDSIAPSPTLAQEGTLVQLQAAADRPYAWIAALSGNVTDPSPSSGVASVRVALIDPQGVPIAGGSQAATVSSGVWTINYLLTEPLISGEYTVQLEAEDKVGNHTTSRLHSILLDRSAPQAVFDGPPPGGSLAFWRLDEAAGAVIFNDSSGFGNTAVCDLSCPLSGELGKYGNGITLSAGQSIKTNSPLAFSDNGLALSAWFLTGATSQGTLFTATDSTGVTVVSVKLDMAGSVVYSITPGDGAVTVITTKKKYNDNAWHHLSAMWQPGQVQLLMDGQIVRTIEAVPGTMPATLNVTVGRDGGGDYFNGKVDDISIQGVHLTPSEVRSLAYYNPGLKQSQVTLNGTISELGTTQGAVLALHLEETASPFEDSSDYDNDATCAGTACPVSDSSSPYGAARRFDGLDDALSIKSSSLNYLTNELTVMAWVKPEQITGVQRVLGITQCSAGGGLGFGLSNSGLIFTTYRVKDYYSSGVNLALNQWQHIAAVMGADNAVTFYMNGIEIQTITGDAPAVVCLGDIQIGHSIATTGISGQPFKGSIDEVQVFDRALASTEILAMAQKQNGGIRSLEIAYATDLAGSTRYNTQPLPDTQLAIPMDDSEDAEGNVTFQDISGTGHSGTCAQPNCPTPGQSGHTGSGAMFEGTDNLTIAKRPSDVTSDYYTISAWLYPIGLSDGTDTFISRYDWAVARYSDGSIRWVFRSGSVNNVWINTGVKPEIGKWTHISVVFDAGVVKTYADGVLKHTYPAPPNRLPVSVNNASTLNIGGWPSYSHYYTGGMDDVNLFNRAFTGSEVMALYLGSEPVLHLPFNESWLVNGNGLADTSGWEQNAILTSGESDESNKVIQGQVGGGALQLDGVDDFVQVANQTGLNYSANQDFSVSLWVKADSQVDTLNDDNSIVEKWSGVGGYPFVIRYVNSSGNIYAARYDGTFGPAVGSTTVINDNQFHHVAFIKRGANLYLYIDGMQQGTVPDTTTGNTTNTSPLFIGMRGNSINHFKGAVDDLQIYARALSDEEVQALNSERWQPVFTASDVNPVMRGGWSLTPPSGLEGHYRVDMRSQDNHGNQSIRSSAWDGVLDTTLPRTTLTYEGGPTTYTLRFSAQDWNLDEAALVSPCPSSTPLSRTFFNPPWYRSLTGVATANSSRLYTLEGSCLVTLADPATASLTACDQFGNCSTVNAGAAVVGAIARAPAQPTGQVLILTPAPGAVVNNLLQISISGSAQADTYLKRLTVSVDGKKVLNLKWDKQSLQTYDWETTWTPTKAGPHLVEAVLTDWKNAEVKHHVIFLLDTAAPNLTITTSVLTTTHVLINQLPIRGTARDENGIAMVEVQVESEGYTSGWTPATLDGDTWEALVYPGHDYQPDDELLRVNARATDRAGLQRVLARSIPVDLQPPAPSALAITYDDMSGTTPITRTGTILTGNTPTLHLRWPASSDAAGISGYRAGWTVKDANGVVDTAVDFGPTDNLLASYQAGEAQQLTAGVAAIDRFGNTQSQSFGPIYVDSPLTPDYIRLDDTGETYHGWMDSSCSLLGQDRRVNDRQPDTATRGRNQALYTSWDSQALRIAWTGANWSGDGDLFVYLDSTAGGTLDAMNPFTTTATLQMPGMLPVGPRTGAMYADYVVWVQDNQEAWLYRWDGTTWSPASQLESGEYRFSPGLNNGTTDLYLTFEQLGIVNPDTTPLKLVALATEEDSLQIWAVLPKSNPVTSPFVTALPRVEQVYGRFALNHPFNWHSLRSGICPNGSQALQPDQRQYTDDDLQLSVTTDPAGASYRYLGDHLFGWWLTLFEGKPAEFSSLLATIANEQGRVRDGQEISYRVNYRNDGAEAAQDVMLQIHSRLALTLPDGVSQAPGEHSYFQEIYIGDVAPGQSGVVTVRGEVDLAWAEAAYQSCLAQHPAHPLACRFNKRWTWLSIQVFDQAHTPADGPRELMWVDHRVDSEPPLFAGVDNSAFGISAVSNNTLRGYAFDESGVETVKVEIAAPDGTTTQMDCPDPTPLDGRWNCGININPAAQEGEVYRIRLQAIDSVGYISAWSPWQTFVVDRTAADITVSPVPTNTAGGPPVNLNWLDLRGQVRDNYGVRGVEICQGASCESILTQLETREWSYPDSLSNPLAIADCSNGKLVRTFNIPDGHTVGEIRLGFKAEAADRDRLKVELTSPSGLTWQLLGDDFDLSTKFANWNVILSDRAVAGLSALRAGQIPTAAGFAAFVRPLQPLAIFRGQAATGTWQLSVCQENSAGEQALYHGAELWVEPENTAPLAGIWKSNIRLDALDDVQQTLLIYGIDQAGNRSSTPQVLTFRIDNVTPVLIVSKGIAQLMMLPDLAPQTVLTGSVSDGGNVVRMHAYVRDPQGIGYSQRPVVHDDLTWQLDLQPMKVGVYQVWIAAEDEAGNLTSAGPFAVDVSAIPGSGAGAASLRSDGLPAATISPTPPITPTLTVTPTLTITPTLTLVPTVSGMPFPLPILTETPSPVPAWTGTPMPPGNGTPTPTTGGP